MRSEFSTAQRILFGAGVAVEAPASARSLGRRALLIHGRGAARSASIGAELELEGLDVTRHAVVSEPTVDVVREGVARARAAGCDVVVAIGGGSVIDAGKAIAALCANDGDILDYIEIIGRGRPLRNPSLPWIAIPTTAGTGAEVTRNAVIASRADGVKASLRGPMMLAAIAIVDPDLLRGLPARVVAATGLDALSQLIEPYVCARANPTTDALCREGLRRSVRSLRHEYSGEGTAETRADLAAASLMSGMALANAGLGAVHGLAAPIGGRFPAPHGAVCATLLPHVMDVNLRALRARTPGAEAIERYREVAVILTGRNDAVAEDGSDWVRELVDALHLPRLSSFGLTRDAFSTLIERAKGASSMRANPIALTDGELQSILDAAL